MKIAVFGRQFRDDATHFIKDLFLELQTRGVEVLVFENFEHFLFKKKIKSFATGLFSTEMPLEKVDFVFCVGGDGTFLESITHVKDKEIPVLGINAGRLGFLAITPKEKIKEDINSLLEGKYQIEDRSLVHLDTNEDAFEGMNFGLNEFCILKKDTSSMILVHAYLDGMFLNSYWSDGLIVATPTGSTAYALSCGGPVLMPTANNFVITPISPHNLNVRPIVVPDSGKITFKIEGRSKNFLISLDSRSKTVSANVELCIRKEDFKVKLVKMEYYNFLNTLRSKLNWGLDNRI
ncbi:MAG: NAD kinase [Cytophagales bacterium]